VGSLPQWNRRRKIVAVSRHGKLRLSAGRRPFAHATAGSTRMHTGDAAPHPFRTLLLLYKLLWPAMWPALFAEAVVIAMILRAGW
jgi:hypothetical protein